MEAPEDPLSPVGHRFAESWHAQTLATAHALIRAGHISQGDWAKALGSELKRAEAKKQPETEETYYLAALSALEQVGSMSAEALSERKTAWAEAYNRTPHGKPVLLG